MLEAMLRPLRPFYVFFKNVLAKPDVFFQRSSFVSEASLGGLEGPAPFTFTGTTSAELLAVFRSSVWPCCLSFAVLLDFSLDVDLYLYQTNMFLASLFWPIVSTCQNVHGQPLEPSCGGLVADVLRQRLWSVKIGPQRKHRKVLDDNIPKNLKCFEPHHPYVWHFRSGKSLLRPSLSRLCV